MAKKIFIWVGHPRQSSLSHGLADAFASGAGAQGADIRRMTLGDMDFDPDLSFGYHKRKELEPDLQAWRENILWADHVCWAYPQWWGGMPAKMKGVIDRAFLPGFAMRYHDKGLFWDRLLEGRSADVIMTSDTPPWFDRWIYHAPAMNQVATMVLKYSGMKPVRRLQIGPVKTANKSRINRWLDKARNRGAQAAQR